MTVLITLTTYGSDTGPYFDLYSNLDYITPFETGVAKADLIAGYVSTLVPDFATVIRVQSTGECTNYVDISVLTTTTTSSSSTTTTTTGALTYYTWYITEGTSGNCGDNVGSTPYYSDPSDGNEVTAFYTDTDLLTLYNAGGTGTIVWSSESGGLAQHKGALDTPTAISYTTSC